MILRPGYLPNMYVLGLLPFAALIVAGTSESLWRRSQATSFSVLAWSARAAIAALAAVMVLVVAPRWVETDRQATSVKLDGPRRTAERWLVENIGHEERVIVGDEFWIYLVEHGFDRLRPSGPAPLPPWLERIRLHRLDGGRARDHGGNSYDPPGARALACGGPVRSRGAAHRGPRDRWNRASG
jgi:membrane protein implicated in regulation of membrane protease activity